MTPPKTALVTGTSKGGIGDHLAQELHRRGFRVFATARTPAKVEHLKGLGLDIIRLDVSDSDSIKKAAAEVNNITGGRLDLLVNNSGVGHKSSLLDADIKSAKAVFDVNVFGLLEVTQAFAPLLVASKGRVVNIGSIAGIVPIPFEGIYNASKSAVELLSAQMRVEFMPFGVDVIHVVTGGVKGEFYTHAELNELPESSLYWPCREQIRPWLTGEGQKALQLTSPESYARSVVDNAINRSPSTCHWVGYGAWHTWFFATFLWRNAMDMMLSVMKVPNMRRILDKTERVE